MESVKLKIVQKILQFLKKITLKLLYLQAKYEADDYAVENEKFDLRAIPDRIKKVFLHDTNIIEARFSECQSCEHFIKPTSQCKKCGCFMKVKTRIATARCPIGKWEREYDFMKGKEVVPSITS